MSKSTSTVKRRGALGRALALVFVLAGGLGLSAGIAPAQDEVDPLAVRGDSLRAELERMSAEYAELRAGLPGLAGEDSVVTARQSRELLLTGIDQIYELAGNVSAQEEQGLDAGALRTYVGSLLDRVPEALRATSGDIEAQVDALHAEIEEAAPGELVVLEEELAGHEEHFDELSTVALQYLDALESVGRDTADLRVEWQETIERRVQLTAGRLRLAVEERDRLESQAEDNPDDADLGHRADAARVAVAAVVASLERRIEIMEQLGGDATEFRTLLVETTGEIARGLDTRVAAHLARAWLEKARDWIVDGAPNLLAKILVFLLILVAFRFLSRIARRAVVRTIDSSKLRPSQLLRNMIANMSGNVVMGLGFLIALSQMGISLGPLLAGLGVAGFIVGFALQETLANFASGLMILFYRPFDIGDLIEAATVRGKVHHMSLVSTTILTIDNQTLIVPNGKIWGDVIRNVTAQTTRRVDLVFGISYTDDIPKAEGVLAAIVKDHPKVLDDPEPDVKLFELGDSSVNFVVRPWVKTDDYWDVYWDVTREVKMRFDAEGIGIPFPQRDVHHYFPQGAGPAGDVPRA